MNCFAHAISHLDDPYLLVGCCLPDWLGACDRKCRVREKHALELVEHEDPIIAATTRGVVQHHQDDAWFHRTPIFNQLILEYAIELRELFSNERSMRPSVIGHVMVELFLDAYLNATYPGALEKLYAQVESVDPSQIQNAVNLFATKPTEKLIGAMGRFKSERYLFDYDTDEGVAYRLNRVFKRVKLEPMDDRIFAWMPQARTRVYENATDLLADLPPIGWGQSS